MITLKLCPYSFLGSKIPIQGNLCPFRDYTGFRGSGPLLAVLVLKVLGSGFWAEKLSSLEFYHGPAHTRGP